MGRNMMEAAAALTLPVPSQIFANKRVLVFTGLCECDGAVVDVFALGAAVAMDASSARKETRALDQAERAATASTSTR
jgi:F0F1-type ATP synthase epsilon subunit